MSTKTNFKRIALVAVAALGLGVLSSVPSNAVIPAASITSSATTGTSGQTQGAAAMDSSTAAIVSMSFTATAADSVSVTVIPKAKPTGALLYPRLLLMLQDTTTSTGLTSVGVVTLPGTNTAQPSATESNTAAIVVAAANTVAAANFKAFIDTATLSTSRNAGTYTWTVAITPYSANFSTQIGNTDIKYQDVSITVAALATASTVASAAYSKAWISTAGAASADVAVNSVATASNTPVGYITVKLRNASDTNSASESVTVTTTVGQVGTSSNRGRSVVLAYSTDMDVNIYADGTAGVATINVSTPSVTFAAKTATFYATAPSKLVASVINSVPGAGSTVALAVKATDAAGIAWAGTLYTYSDTVGVISNAASSCSYVAANSRHECSITTVAAGTAKVTVRDAATVATSTVASDAVSFTTSLSSAATVKLSFDKATYAPGEKATLTVQVLDSAGKDVGGPATYANLFATGGIGTTSGFSAGPGGSATVLTGVEVITAAPNLADITKTGTVPVKTFSVYMPFSGGAVTVSAVGGVSLPTAGQIKYSATATVTDSGAAALAAVNALATTVASLKTLITTLTNLVLKIQKKVKA